MQCGSPVSQSRCPLVTSTRVPKPPSPTGSRNLLARSFLVLGCEFLGIGGSEELKFLGLIIPNVGQSIKKREKRRKGPPPVRLVFVALLLLFFIHNRHRFGASLVHYFVQYVPTGGRIRALSIIELAFLHVIGYQFGGGIGLTKEKRKERKGSQGNVREGGEYSTIRKKKEEERKARGEEVAAEAAAAASETEESKKNHPLSLLPPPPPITPHQTDQPRTALYPPLPSPRNIISLPNTNTNTRYSDANPRSFFLLSSICLACFTVSRQLYLTSPRVPGASIILS